MCLTTLANLHHEFPDKKMFSKDKVSFCMHLMLMYCIYIYLITKLQYSYVKMSKLKVYFACIPCRKSYPTLISTGRR